MDKLVIAPYVRESKLDSLQTSTKVADQSLIYFQTLKHNYPNHLNPAACVVLSLYSFNLITEKRLEQLSKMQGVTVNALLRSVSEIRQLLNLQCEKTYEEIAGEAKIPLRFANTCNKISNDLKKEFEEEETINRAAMKAAIMLVVAVKRGFKRNDVLDLLAKITSTDPKEILENELTVRKLIGNRYGGKNLAPKETKGNSQIQKPIENHQTETKTQDERNETREERNETRKERNETKAEPVNRKEEIKKDKKKIQTKLTFFCTPQKEVFKNEDQ